jgi:type I restriction enzyme S subunit
MTLIVPVSELVQQSNEPLLQIHPSWERVSLAEIANVLNGYAFKSGEFSNLEGFPLLRIRDIKNGVSNTFYTGEFDPLYIVNNGDLVVGMDGDFNSAIWNGGSILLNQRVCKITVKTDCYFVKFLAYALPGYLDEIHKHTSSVTVKHLSSKSVEEIPLPLPPFAEQRRIVAEIEKQFTRLDAAVSALKRLQANLTRYKAAVLKAACEGRLVPQDPNDEPADKLLERILAVRRRKWEEVELAKMVAAGRPPKDDTWKARYQEPEQPDMSGLAELPAGWVWARAEQLCDFITKGTTPASHKLLEDGEVPFIKVYNLTFNGSLDFNTNPTYVSYLTHSGELARSKVFPGDVLMNIVGPPLGKVSIVPNLYHEWNMNQAMAVFRPMPNYSNKFLAVLLMSEPILKWAKQRAKATAGQFNLTLEICRDLPLPVVPLNEQVRIVEDVERRLSIIAKLEKSVADDLARAGRLRQAILQKAFSGRLVPQDPNDESAAVLLERIRGRRKKEQ